MAAIIALVIFILAVFDVSPGGIDMIALGLAFLALALLIGNWPLGTINRS